MNMDQLIHQYIAARNNCVDMEIRHRAELEKAISKVESWERKLTGCGIPVIPIRKPKNIFQSALGQDEPEIEISPELFPKVSEVPSTDHSPEEQEDAGTQIIVETIRSLLKEGIEVFPPSSRVLSLAECHRLYQEHLESQQKQKQPDPQA